MQSPSEAVRGPFRLKIGQTEIKVQVTHHEDSNDRFVCELAPSVIYGDSDLLEEGVGLRVTSPGADDENDGRWDCLNLPQEVTMTSSVPIPDSSFTLPKFWALCYILFTLWPDQESFTFKLPKSNTKQRWCIKARLTELLYMPDWFQEGRKTADGEEISEGGVFRKTFWQGAGADAINRWAPMLGYSVLACVDMVRKRCFTSEVTDNPLSNPKGNYEENMSSLVTGVFYKRYCPELSQTLTFRILDLNSSSDAELILSWKVAQHLERDWCESVNLDDFQPYFDYYVNEEGYALLGELDGIPISYVEVRWDQNLLNTDDVRKQRTPILIRTVFNENVLNNRTLITTTIKSLVHMLFLLDPSILEIRTAPRATNLAMVKCLCEAGGYFSEVR